MIDVKKILKDVLRIHKDSDKWEGAEFERIKRISNTKVGEIGQDFIERICNIYEFECVFPENVLGHRAKQSPWDIQISNIKFELKTATEDTNRNFQFNHIRYHRPYDAVLCLGVSPNDIFFDVWTKAQLVTGKAGSLVSMEKGANASYKLTKRPQQLKSIDEFEITLQSFLNTQTF